MSRSICLNADLGELEGPEGRALDEAILGVVTRCNVACGGHAGDDASMRETVRRAKAAGVRIGAHPSYPDRENFGRLTLGISPNVLSAALEDQVRALLRIAGEQEACVSHLKPHGALYNDAARDAELSELIVAVMHRTGITQLLGPPGSALEAVARSAGVSFVAEGFADRGYEADGSLTPRSLAGAVLTDEAIVEENALRMARHSAVVTRTGETLSLSIGTICLHSDTPGAAAHAVRIREALEAAGIRVEA